MAEKLFKDKLLDYNDIEGARNFFKVSPRGTKTCKFLKDKIKANPKLADIEGKEFQAEIEKECKEAQKSEDEVDSAIGSKVLGSFAKVYNNPEYMGSIKSLLALLDKISV